MKKEIKLYSSNKENGDFQNKLNVMLENLIKILFRKLDFDDESLSTLRNYSTKGRVVYASFQTSNTSLLILTNILKKHNIAVPAIAFGFTPYLIQVISKFITSFVSFVTKKSTEKNQEFSCHEYIENTVNNNDSIILSLLSRKIFIKRYLEIKTDPIEHLVELQKKSDTPIYIFPQIIFWNRNPEKTKMLAMSNATGDRGLLSGFFTTLKSITPAFMRISPPINLKEEIDNTSSDDAKHLAHMIRNKLLEIYASEKRCILGPVIKSQQEMIEKVLYHKNIMDTIQSIKEENRISEKKLRQQAYKYFKEIAADFSIVTIKYFSKTLEGYIFKKLFNGVEYNLEDLTKIREAAQRGPLILMLAHRSHIDYLILSSLFYQNAIIPPHILAGSNLTFFPMGKIFRKSGAFFMRRSFKGLTLYTAVFKQYVKTLINEGYSIEFFIEGGRSRTGKTGFPQMGFLKYLIEAINDGYNKDLIFMPVTINYNRILEENSYHKELKGRQKKAENTSDFVKSRKFLKRNHGRVYFSIGDPISYKEINETYIKSENPVVDIAHYITKRIQDIIMVTPFAITTTAILSSTGRGFSTDIINEKVSDLNEYFKYINAHLATELKSESNYNNIIRNVLESYKQDQIITELTLDETQKGNIDVIKDLYLLNEEDRPRINFYKNNIIHLLLPLSFISISLLNLYENMEIHVNKIKDEYAALKNLFSKEFIFSEFMEDVDIVINTIIPYLEKKGLISKTNNVILINDNKIDKLKFYAALLQDYFESYFIVLNTINNLKDNKLLKKQLLHEIRTNGIKLYHLGEIKLLESLSLANYKNALSMLASNNILHENQIKSDDTEIDKIEKSYIAKLHEDLMKYIKRITNHMPGNNTMKKADADSKTNSNRYDLH